MSKHTNEREQTLHALLQQYPQLNTPQVSRRALLAVSSLMALNLGACGSSDDSTSGTSSSGGNSGGNNSGGGSGGGGSNNPAPTITAISPVSGTTAGGTTVTITGTNLTGATSVMFGSVAGTGITVLNTTQLIVIAPAQAAGVVTVSVTTPGGVATATTNYTYAQQGNGGVVTTLAGSGSQGSTNGSGAAASFNNPYGVAVDSSGNVYVADYINCGIRQITSAGVVTTLAGSNTGGHADGTGTATSFNHPSGVAVDSSGNVYVADTFNNLIRKITSAGVVTTFAGSTSATGSTNGSGAAASFNGPSGVAVDSSGNVYVADMYNNMIRMITSVGVVTIFAGSTTAGSANGTGTAASFNQPSGVAVDSSGNVYVADTLNRVIRQITSAGVVSTLAGSGSQGATNGTGTAASFGQPRGVAVDNSGNVYVADYGNNMIRQITSGAVVTIFAGVGPAGSTDGAATAASFHSPRGVAVDSSGNVYVADTGNNLIRKIS